MDVLEEFFLRTAIEGLLIFFYATVIICIVAQRRKKLRPFSSGFFTLYLLQSAADVGLMVTTVTLTRLPSIGYFVEVFNAFPVGNNAANTLKCYLVSIQFVVHVAIAVDRYRAINALHKKSSRSERRTLIATCILAAPAVIPRTLSAASYVEVLPNTYALLFAEPRIQAVASMVTLFYCAVTTTASSGFDLMTALRYKRLTAENKQKYRQDLLLFLYVLLQLVLQVLYLTYLVVATVSAALGNKVLAGLAQSALTKYLVDATSLSAPICLFTTSKALRQAYVRMYIGAPLQSVAGARFAWMSSTHSGT